MKNFKKTIISISTFALVMAATLSPNSCPISKINPVVPISASAAEDSEDFWEYGISDGGVTITKYTGKAEELTIPSTLGGFPVRYIADNTFYYNNFLKSVKIPEGVKSIGKSAFESCYNLNMISLPSSLVFIGDYAFSYTALEDVVIPAKVNSIGNSAFSSCTKLKKISLPSSLEIIRDSTFIFTALEDVVIPSKVKSIEKSAFACTSLVNVVIPKNVTSIGAQSFDSIESLKTVTIMGNPDLNVSADAFGYSESIESIKINYNYISKLTKAFKNCVNLKYINDKSILNEDNHCINKTYLDIIKNLEDNKYVNEYTSEYVPDKAMHIVNTVTNSSMTDFQKAKALHDWICNKVAYDYDDKDAWKNHIEGSVFLYDSTVCEGYARGYNLLLNLAGIESYYVYSDGCSAPNGETHAWNIVKLGDHYFHIDVCWDDGKDYYPWFMNSDTEVNAYGFEKEKWKAENAEATPTCDLALGDVDDNKGIVDEADIEYLSYYLENKPGYEISEGDKIFADLDFNGVIDNHDLELLKKKVDYFNRLRLLNS